MKPKYGALHGQRLIHLTPQHQRISCYYKSQPVCQQSMSPLMSHQTSSGHNYVLFVILNKYCY